MEKSGKKCRLTLASAYNFSMWSQKCPTLKLYIFATQCKAVHSMGQTTVDLWKNVGPKFLETVPLNLLILDLYQNLYMYVHMCCAVQATTRLNGWMWCWRGGGACRWTDTAELIVQGTCGSPHVPYPMVHVYIWGVTIVLFYFPPSHDKRV